MEKATFRTLCLCLLLSSSASFSQVGTFQGRVIYQNSTMPMSGVTAYLHSAEDSIIATATTDYEGFYSFANVTAGDYIITFTTEETASGVALDDPYLLLNYLSDPDLYPLTDIQELAADVNGNGNVNMGDYNAILHEHLNQDEEFDIGPWVFETVSTPIPIPSREGYITSRGSSSGDVNGSLVPDPKSNSIFQSNPVVNLTTDASEPFEFNLSCGQNIQIAGMHLAINVPEELNVISIESAIPSANIFFTEGQIRVTWIDKTQNGFEITDGTPLLVIRTMATRLSRDENSYSLKLADESHFIDVKGELIQGVSLILPTINVNVQKDLNVSAYPNPFLNEATIDYQLPQEGHVIIALFDQSGRQVQEIVNGIGSAGSHQAKIDGFSLMPGIYHFSIRVSGSDQFTNTGTMIKSK